MKNGWKLLAGIAMALVLSPQYAMADYKSDTDTGADRLDFIENRRRFIRENALTDEQKKLLEDAKHIKDTLRKPLDPTKPVPTVFEGDDLTYDQRTGEFVAKGKVHIVQMDAHQFDSEEEGVVQGNTIRGEIEIPGKAHMLQLTPDQSRITLDGYNTFYNYGEKTGTMDEAAGKVDHQYVTGKRFEFYPDHVVIYNGTSTKCNAKVPDYHIAAEKITIWPNDKMIMEKVKVCLKGKTVYTKDQMVQDLRPGAKGPEYPRVGYNSSDGVWIAQEFTYPLLPRVDGMVRPYYSSKHGARSRGELTWINADSSFRVAYGYYSDIDEHWVKREPSFIYKHERRIGTTPLHYVLDYEIGKWKRKQDNAADIESTHRYGRLGVYRDPIRLPGNWFLLLSGGYQITKETYDDSTRKGFDYTLATLKEFDKNWAAYGAFEYSVSNTTNSLFAYGVNDVAKAIKTGLSYRIGEHDRLVYGIQYDMENRTLKDIDYYWYHDVHCAQIILRYRAKRKSWQVRWEFIPW